MCKIKKNVSCVQKVLVMKKVVKEDKKKRRRGGINKTNQKLKNRLGKKKYKYKNTSWGGIFFSKSKNKSKLIATD